MKSPSIAVYDMIHAIVVIVAEMLMSWNKSKDKLDCIITKHELKSKNKELAYMNKIDPLTNSYNRRNIFEKFEKIKKECVNENKKMCCIVLYIDKFKKYKDTYGHPAGDSLLIKIGKVLKECSAANNINIGRIGGEEFMAVWKEQMFCG